MARDKLFLLILAAMLLLSCMHFEKKTDLSQQVKIPSDAEKVVLLAKKDLAARLKVPMASISVISVEAVNWSDTSLGFPREGMAYAQVITPGYRIILFAKGMEYEYHSNHKRIVSENYNH